MKVNSKVILILLVGLAGITHLYRETQLNAVEEARARLLAALDPAKVNTTATRTSNSQNYCAKPRSELVTAADLQTTKEYFNILKTYFNIDP